MFDLTRGTVMLSTMLASGLAMAQSVAPAADPAPQSDVTPVVAASPALHAEASPREEAQAMAEAAERYREALRAAEVDQREALEAVEAAREQLTLRAQREFERARESAEASEAARSRQSEQMRAEQEIVRRELERAHESLRRASREVTRVHRELNRPHRVLAPSISYSFGDRPIVGVVMGKSDEKGVHLLGVSPDGPADRAGMKQGDIIVAVMGESLAGDDLDGRVVLGEVMGSVEAGDELVFSVERDGQLHEYTVVAENREPYTWHNRTRLASAPSAGASVFIERIEVPEIDREALDAEMARVQESLDQTRIVIRSSDNWVEADGDQEFTYEFEEFSELGDAVLAETNVWFGLPMTRGLKMAELDPELGEYFKAERGVLVLKAGDDNALQLRTGDVIQSIAGTEVSKPADVMRALRNVESGQTVDIEIKRERKSRTLNVEVPSTADRVGFAPMIEQFHQWSINPEVEYHFAPHVSGHD